MSAIFDWIDTPGLFGDVLLLVFFATIYLVAAHLLAKTSRAPKDGRKERFDW